VASRDRGGPRARSWAIGTILALACGPAAEAAQGQESAPAGIAGQVVDETGAGVAAAEVLVIGGPWDEPEIVAEATTNDLGEFSFPSLWDDQGRGKAGGKGVRSFDLAARAGGRIGWDSSIHPANRLPIAIELSRTVEARGRLVDFEGRPIAGAEVVPTLFTRERSRRFAAGYLRLTPALAEPYKATTAADGTFAIRGVPEGCGIHATLSTRGFGAPRVAWESSQDTTIILDGRLGQIEGRLVPPDAEELATEIPLTLSRNSPGEAERGSFVRVDSQTLKVGGDGRFCFGELSPGRYTLSAWPDPGSRYKAESIRDLEVGPDARIAGLEIPLVRLVTIAGRVVDATSGEGVVGVGVSASILVGNSLHYADQGETDAEGRYSVRVAPGTILIYPNSAPKTHIGIAIETCPRLDVPADRDWPDIRLPRAVAIDGLVVDRAGKPVDGAVVHLVKPSLLGFADGGLPVKAGPDGAFRFEQLDPDDTLPVRARTREATTDGAVVIRPGMQAGPLVLTLDPNHAARVHGTVVDGEGKPVAGAAVTLWWTRNYVSEKTQLSGLGNAFESYTTSIDGRFASTALWPGDVYKVAVTAEGYGQAESPEIAGRSGEDHDFGAIRLVGIAARIVGRVVDSAGNPAAGATVFNRGDGPRPATATTDADGRFRLEGLYAGGRYAFVRKEGYRFAGARVEGDADEVTVRLLRVDEPPPAWEPAGPATPEQDHALAKRLLTKIWDRYGAEADTNGAVSCIDQMARIDPALAFAWSAQAGGRYDGRVNQAAAHALAETDADGALELLTAPGVDTRPYVLQKLAERFADEDRAKALKFAEEAAVRARGIDQPDRAGAMAKAGALLARLGREEVGRALIVEGAEAAARMGLDERQGYARGNVAGALAPFDLDRALALVEPMKAENDRDRYLGFIAMALAPTDPDRALTVAAKIGERSSSPLRVKVAIAYHLGLAGRTDDAVRVIEGMAGDMATKHQAEAYGWLAVAVAPRDPSRAAAFIDQALALPVDRPEGFESWVYYGGGTGAAAWIAACARRADYPDMAGAVARVLASRPSGRNRDPSMEARSLASAAAALAITDPRAARQILRAVESRSGLGPADLARVADRHWLMAWALADPSHAEELFDAGLAALDGQPAVNLLSTGLLKLPESLAQPRHRREDFLRDQVGATWYPGIEE